MKKKGKHSFDYYDENQSNNTTTTGFSIGGFKLKYFQVSEHENKNQYALLSSIMMHNCEV